MAPVGIAIVGLGQRSSNKAIDAINKSSGLWALVAATDPDPKARFAFHLRFPDVPVFETTDMMLQWNAQQPVPALRAVYVAVPHHIYRQVILPLLRAHLHVLKEKPAATSVKELKSFQQSAMANSALLSTASQRRYGKDLSKLKEWLPLVGTIHRIEASRKICVENLAEGWRASNTLSGGGAMADIGWHLLDVVVGLVGATPDCPPSVLYFKLFHIRSHQRYDCEDSAEVILGFPSLSNDMTAHLTVSWIGHRQIESVIATGDQGVLAFDGHEVAIHFDPTSGKQHLVSNSSQEPGYRSDFSFMFADFRQEIGRHASSSGMNFPSAHYSQHCLQDLVVICTLSDIYQHRNGQTSSQKRRAPLSDCHAICPPIQQNPEKLTMEWPIIDSDIKKAVSKQLQKDISIYDNGGIFEQFEKEFKDFHGVPSSYALLHNSGTNGLQALYFAAGLKPADETKAVVVCHIWGIPCDMEAIFSILDQWPSVLLIEDCSHVHGAKNNGKAVGTFGDRAAWSLQGQKIVTGGEGGITVTKHADFHYRMLIFGHYNKRCKVEIPADYYLRQFSLTGAGLKNRAHPLAIAIALNQLRKLGDFHACKSIYARQLASKLACIPFLEMPIIEPARDAEPAWYAFVMRFKAAKAPNGLTREVFVKALHSCGLSDVDIPMATGLLHKEPLFTKPWAILPHLYSEQEYSVDFASKDYSTAQQFYDKAIKLPVYATKDDQAATNCYANVVMEIATKWMTCTPTTTRKT